jgi:glycosyltransferase involved in cell wall biosynthesis
MVTRELTVAITSFNREGYLRDSIESVLSSTFENFELLVVDDASSDGSVELAQSYARTDERVRVVVNESNLGDYPNRNRALELVTTPFLKYHDSDDLMYRHCLETMMDCLREEPTAGFALSSARAWVGGPCPMLLTPRMAYRREFLGGGLFHCGPSGGLFRTEVLREHGGFPLRGAASDFCFWINACRTTPVLLVPGDLFWYRVHDGQEIMKPASARDYATTTGESWKALLSEDCPLFGEELVQAKRACTHQLLRLVYKDACSKRWSLIPFRIKNAGIRFGDFVRFPPKSCCEPRTGSPIDDNGDYLVPLRVDETTGHSNLHSLQK